MTAITFRCVVQTNHSRAARRKARGVAWRRCVPPRAFWLGVAIGAVEIVVCLFLTQ